VTDIYDQATEREERDRAAAIAAARTPAPRYPAPTGCCLNCQDDLLKPLMVGEAIADRWCCIECRDDWVMRVERKGA